MKNVIETRSRVNVILMFIFLQAPLGFDNLAGKNVSV